MKMPVLQQRQGSARQVPSFQTKSGFTAILKLLGKILQGTRRFSLNAILKNHHDKECNAICIDSQSKTSGLSATAMLNVGDLFFLHGEKFDMKLLKYEWTLRQQFFSWSFKNLLNTSILKGRCDNMETSIFKIKISFNFSGSATLKSSTVFLILLQ